MATRVLVTGDRGWPCTDLALRVVRRLAERYGAGLTVVHGDASGVDKAFAVACRMLKVREEPHPAEWDDLGRPDAVLKLSSTGSYFDAMAGPRRNAKMIATGIDLCIACHRFIRKSKGTRDCVSRCFEAGIPVYLIDADDAEPRRIREV